MTPPDVTTLLQAWGAGDAPAREAIIPLVYAELHRRAAALMRRERGCHTLQPTALVHEAYLRLIDQRRTSWQNRAQFFGIACALMRRVLIDHARRRQAAKGPGQWQRVTFDTQVAGLSPPDVDVLDLDAALTRLAGFDPRKSRIAELRFFVGLSLEETAHVLGVSVATVERDWQVARAWLYQALKEGRS